MTRLSANARTFLPLPVSERLAYPHLARPRVSFGGITACRRFPITREERSCRMWAWNRGGAEGETPIDHNKPINSKPYPSKIKPKDSTAAAPFEVPPEPEPEPIPTDLHKRVIWRETQATLVRQKTENISTPFGILYSKNQPYRLYATGAHAREDSLPLIKP